MQQLEPGFRRTINWNNYQSKATKQTQNQYLDYLVDPSLQGVHRLIVLSFENDAHWRCYTWYFFLIIKKEDYKSYDWGKNCFYQRAYDNIWKTMTGQVDDYICLFQKLL